MSFAYQSASSASSGAGSDAAFQQADSNQDGRIDLNEFRNFLGQNLGASGASGYESASFGGAAGASSFESASYESSATAGGLAGGYDASFAAGADAGAGAGVSSYESSSFSSSANFGGDAGVAVANVAAGDASFESSSSNTQVQQYATDAQGLFKDPNPQVIRRAAVGGVQTYTQNIKIRFLQPPPLPPPGPLIIKEVRPPQPPPPPPLRIRQQAPPLPTPPPLILRERPPQAPASVAAQTVIRRLAAIPVPPRSVIIERLPALPPRPRDIIIERWVPYGAQAKRRTIVQRAAAAKAYPAPRNVIIQYEPVQVRIVRQFQRLGVVQANPQSYVQQYGAQLLDASTLVSQARAAGVVEDISPPAVAASSANFSASSFSQQAGFEGEAGLAAGGVALDAGAAGGFSSSSYESSSYTSGAGLDAGFGGAAAGLGAGFGASSSSYESASYSSTGAGAGGVDAFTAADTNRDGTLDQSEFRNFLSQNIGGASLQ